MTEYILRRLIQSVFIVWGCATLVFFMLRLIPGDPVVQMLGPEYTPEAADALRAKLGLDEPLYVQYVKWFGNILQGDLGDSITGSESVVDAIKTGLPKTLSLAARLVLDRAVARGSHGRRWLRYGAIPGLTTSSASSRSSASACPASGSGSF